MAQLEIMVHAAACLPKILLLNILKHCKISLPQSIGKRNRIYVGGKGSRFKMGKRCILRDNVEIRIEGGNLTIGEKCFVNRNTTITCIEEIRIGSGTQIANNVTIVDHDHNYRNANNAPLISSKISIGENVWIGANCVILRGAIIGDGAVIAAGSVIKGTVDKDILLYQQRENKLTVIKRGTNNE